MGNGQDLPRLKKAATAQPILRFLSLWVIGPVLPDQNFPRNTKTPDF